MENLVEIDRSYVVARSGSEYLLIPKAMGARLTKGDKVIFYQSADSADIVLRKVEEKDG